MMKLLDVDVFVCWYYPQVIGEAVIFQAILGRKLERKKTIQGCERKLFPKARAMHWTIPQWVAGRTAWDGHTKSFASTDSDS